MKKTITVSAKKVEDAISEGLAQLGVSMEEAEVKILSSGGIFKKAQVEISIGKDDEPTVTAVTVPVAKPIKQESGSVPVFQKTPAPQKKSSDKPVAKAENAAPKNIEKPAREKFDTPRFIKPEGERQEKRERKRRNETPEPATPETAQKATEFLKGMLSRAGIAVEVESDISDGLSLKLITEESLVLGHRGETLDALQYLTSLAVNTVPGKYTRVNLDALEYRARRAETLKRLAGRMAEKCIHQNRRLSLEPMSSSDRKEIHAYLQDLGGVVTKSEGFEPNRRIVIYPKK